MGEPYNTNLAAEFHILSLLHRLGADAALSLGNKKAVDITVVRAEGGAVTIDVKGVAGRYDWPADNIHHRPRPTLPGTGQLRGADQRPGAGAFGVGGAGS